MNHAINWFEIPVTDFNRAKAFYETILSVIIGEMPFPEGRYGLFPADPMKGEVGGGLVLYDGYVPSDKGTMVYLSGGNDLAVALGKVEAAGGKVLMPKTSIGGNGFMAQFLDTEGNRVALHSMQ